MNKAELIRHEIEKRRDHNLAIGNPLFVAMAEEDIELLLFIDSKQEEPVSVWHNASEKPERDDLLIETNDGRIIHRQSINNYGMVKRWAYTSVLLNLDNSCNLKNNSQEEPVREDLGDYINELSKQFPEVSFAKLSRIAVRAAKWQKEQDQSTIELAENHAMLAGMEKMEQQIMAKAVETTFNVSLPSGIYDKLWIKGCKEGDKLLVIKKDEL